MIIDYEDWDIWLVIEPPPNSARKKMDHHPLCRVENTPCLKPSSRVCFGYKIRYRNILQYIAIYRNSTFKSLHTIFIVIAAEFHGVG